MFILSIDVDYLNKILRGERKRFFVAAKMPRLKLMTWNVNSVKTLRQYHPWSSMSSFSDILKTLDCDIVCFQETKLARAKLEQQFALVDGFDAYFSFSQLRKGYSGTATYCRNSGPNQIAVYEAYDGFSRLPFAAELDPAAEWQQYDDEGRTVITDHGAFIVINVYCPNETSEERMPFKMGFYRALESITRHYVEKLKRTVIIVGDVNACRSEMDHCDPERSLKEHNLLNFSDHPARMWLDSFVTEEKGGIMIDLFRHRNPDKSNVYTCWNTLLNARPANYGARIDYILISKDLLSQVADCSVEGDIMGSDHCPVSAVFDISESERSKVFSKSMVAAPLCAKNYPEFVLKQKTLLSYFSSKQSKPPVAKQLVRPDSGIAKDEIIDPNAPVCRHGEPCKEYTVNKNNENKGRKFFLCNRPVGKGFDDDTKLTEFRCNFFQWRDRPVDNSKPIKPLINTASFKRTRDDENRKDVLDDEDDVVFVKQLKKS